MPAQDDLTAQTTEIQDALRHVLQESGAAGSGPLNLPPPAVITSEQARSESGGDPFSYSNNLSVDLYRDADGKVWTEPGPGHEEPNLKMRIRKGKGQWHVVTELRKITRRRARKDRVLTDYETTAMTASGAPVTELGTVERFEQFSPQDAKTAMRQAIAALQAKGSIYVYDPNAPLNVAGTGGSPDGPEEIVRDGRFLRHKKVVNGTELEWKTPLGDGPDPAPAPAATAGLISNGLLGIAAASALAAAAAFAGLGPFAVGATPVEAAPVAPQFVTPTPFVKLTGSGTIGFALPARYGAGSSITEYNCQNTFLNNANPNPSGNPFGEPAMGVRGLLNGHSFDAFFTATRTFVIFENVSLTPAMAGGPAQTYAQGQRVAGTVAIHSGGPENAGTPLGSGTVTIDLTCTGGPVAGGAAVVTPVAAPVAPAGQTQNGSSPWGPGLAVLAIAAAGAGFATKAGFGPLAAGAVLSNTQPGSRQRTSTPDCSKLEAALRELDERRKRYQARADAAWVRARSTNPLSREQVREEIDKNKTYAATIDWSRVTPEWEAKVEADAQARAHEAAEKEAQQWDGALANLKNKQYDVHVALEKCLAGVAPDDVPMTLHERTEPTWSDGGFLPTPPSDEPDDEDRSKRQEVG